GCVLQPKVAVLGYPGDASGNDLFPTPTGLRPPAQGCRTRLHWGRERQRFVPNPNGVASSSPRLPYSATLGTRAATICSQPQRGCVLQPKVAVLVSTGDASGNDLFPTQTGLRPPAQGCRTRLRWGRERQRFVPNPNGVASSSPRLPYS